MPSKITLHVVELFAVAVTLGISYFVTTVFIGLLIGAELAVTVGFYIVFGLTLLLSAWALLRNWLQFRGSAVSEDEYEHLHQIVEEVAAEMGMKKPAVGVDTETGGLNAFATYVLPTRPLIVVTEPMLRVDEDILRAVVAHELSHVKSRDMYLTIFLTHIETGLETIEKFLRRAATGSLVGALVFGPFYLVALASTTLNTILFFLVSRTREYKADYDAAEATSSEAMIEALQLLNANQPAKKSASESLIQTVPREVSDALFSTHPDIEDRIQTIQKNFH